MTVLWSELHTFIIYVLSGYTLLYLVLPAFLKIFKLEHPLQRLQFYLLALITPPAGFVLYHTVLTKRCQAGHGDRVLHLLCDLSGHLLSVIFPLMGIMLALGLLKAATGALLVARLKRRNVFLEPPLREHIDRILARLCANLDLRPPGVIYSNRKGFAAFTAGLLKPVLVLNAVLIQNLEKKDLEVLLSHELIHIRRKDTLKSWLLHLVRDITFFNPVSSWLLKRYLQEKELLCDREAAELIGRTPREYAAVLLRVWRSLLEQRLPRSGMVSAFQGGGGSLEHRVKSLLRLENAGERRPVPGGILLPSVILFVLVLFFLGLVC